ncbi:hypothetical protein [Alicyclobacillus tolerans]|uniref:hypothetical protein n=1 Tax=Alicyclobacillus tolerans TaxID=90970 RepID=UPI003B98715F
MEVKIGKFISRCTLAWHLAAAALQALVKRKMIEIAERVYILADHSKIQVRDFTSIASLDEVDVLITDLQVPEEQIEDIRKFGVEVFQV